MTQGRCVLVAEDDPKIAALLADYLRAGGYAVLLEADGRRAVVRAREAAPDAMILDLMLPGLDGIAVCQAVRAFSTVPILMLTARVDEADRLAGLNTGADDYICKPFSPREVVARLAAQLRRAAGDFPATRRCVVVDDAAQSIIWHGIALKLTRVEFRLLAVLLRRPGTVFSRACLLDALHDDFRDTSDRVIDSHIKNIRRKIGLAGQDGEAIVAVYGAGYRVDLG